MNLQLDSPQVVHCLRCSSRGASSISRSIKTGSQPDDRNRPLLLRSSHNPIQIELFVPRTTETLTMSDRMDVDVDAQTVPRCPSTVVVGMPTRPGARVSFAPTAETQLYTSILGPNPYCSHRLPLTLDKPIGRPYRTNMENSQERGVNNRWPRRMSELQCFRRLLAAHDYDILAAQDNATMQDLTHAIDRLTLAE